MDVINGVPLIITHIGETFVTQDARIVDQNIDTPIRIDSRLYDFIALSDGIVIRSCYKIQITIKQRD